jgi:uncharacterized protein YdhG (YjbR/CyaY superfamily)
MKRPAPKDVDEYIGWFQPTVQRKLQQLRSTIRRAVPNADETISYQIPTYKLDGAPVVYFAGFERHVSVYPAPRGAPELAEELSAYAGGRGTVQFPLSEPIPLDLVRRIVAHRVKAVAAARTSRSGKRSKAGASKTSGSKRGPKRGSKGSRSTKRSTQKPEPKA